MKPKKACILIVDDDPVFRVLMTRILEINGYKCEEAIDGSSALNLILQKEFDMVVMDIQMPYMSGIEVYNHLESKKSPIVNKILFVTGDYNTNPIQDFIKEKGCQCLPKPFNIEELQKKVKNII